MSLVAVSGVPSLGTECQGTCTWILQPAWDGENGSLLWNLESVEGESGPSEAAAPHPLCCAQGRSCELLVPGRYP